MRGVLVDSNVLIDISVRDPHWYEWSRTELTSCLNTTRTVINALIYAELAANFGRVEDLDRFLPEKVYARENLPWSAAFLAGQAFAVYRRRGGSKRSPLPDFYIGAHAAAAGYHLLTRDARRFRSYFPSVGLICPPEA